MPLSSASSIASRLWLASLILLLAGTLGGGRGSLGDVLCQGLAVMLLTWLAWRTPIASVAWARFDWRYALPLLLLLPPLLQLLPLPPGWWSAGAARGELLQQLQQAAVPAPRQWSLNPLATERALLSLLPSVALYLITLRLDTRAHIRLLAVVLVLAVVNVLLGMAQLADGPQSALRFYSPTNPSEAVGFFANRNHLASLLAMALPLAIAATAWMFGERHAIRRWHPLWIVAGIGLVALLVLGIALARSRAGLLLGMLAALLGLPMVLGLRRRRGARRLLVLALGTGVVLSVQFALLGILHRLESDPLEDSRWQYARTTIVAAAAFAPLGSGIGTFRQAYPPFEQVPGSVVVNHAHNDYLELWMEGGWMMAPVFVLAGLAWLNASWRVWRVAGDPPSEARTARLLARACWTAVSLALLHETLDYPLRTTAAASVFAVLLAIMWAQATRAQTLQGQGLKTDSIEPPGRPASLRSRPAMHERQHA